MKRYKINLITCFFVILLTFNSCDQDILNRLPLDEMNDQAFWTSQQNLELYSMQFYGQLPRYDGFDIGAHKDSHSDNVYAILDFSSILKGTRVVPSSGGGWSYGNIRNVNYFLDNYERAELGLDDIKQQIGEVYFFRAYFYFNMVKSFGDVQWFDKVQNTDSEEIYKARDPRHVVINHIIEDLDKAIEYLGSGKLAGGNQLNSESALLFKSRVCLYEGTWEKYHAGTPFAGNGDISNYLTLAADAAKKVMDSDFSIYNTGDTGDYGDYARLFNQNDYSGNPEIILWRKYDNGLDFYHFAQRFNNMWPKRRAVAASLVDSYLCTDGKPISVSNLFQGYDLEKVHINRDSRLGQTVYFPGDLWQFNSAGFEKIYQFPNHTGRRNWQCPGMYRLQKLNNPDLDLLVDGAFHCNTGFVLFRYAEALLNYAEAKAELDDLSQADIDITINVLRDRAGVAPLNKGAIVTDPNWEFPSLSPLINEVRRERRVELAFEAFRYPDLMRWRAHHLIVGKRPKGGKFIDYYNGKSKLTIDADGNVDFWAKQIPNGYEFDPNRDYLAPIPLDQITLTEGAVTQNPGWQ